MIIGVGQYVRTPEGVEIVFGKTESKYEIALVERDAEVTYPATLLAAWTPCERVAESGNEDGPVNIVVETGEEISLVKWDGLLRQVSFCNVGLEPAWTG